MVRYLPRHNALFLHIPRTGGTWVQQALQVAGVKFNRWLTRQPPDFPKKHCLIGHYRPEQSVDYVFCFVRHPVSYYRTLWKWMEMAGRSGRSDPMNRWRWHPKRHFIPYYSPDINQFVRDVCDHQPGYVTRLFEWYCGPEGGEYCQFIGRQETLVDDFCHVLYDIGHTFDEEAVRTLAPMHTSETVTGDELTEETQRLIERTERLAITRFYPE